MSVDGTALVRQEWEEGHRRLESERGDPGRYRVLLQQVDVITDELRRRVGHTYSLGELAAAYRDAEEPRRLAEGEPFAVVAESHCGESGQSFRFLHQGALRDDCFRRCNR